MKSKKKAAGKPYRMPISHERSAHMLQALLAHIHHLQGLDRGAALDEATAGEIADALYKLRAIYFGEALRQTQPNRREAARDLHAAMNVQYLVAFCGMSTANAIEAIAGKPAVEPDSAARTQRNRYKKAESLGVTPDFKVIHAILKKTKKKTEE